MKESFETSDYRSELSHRRSFPLYNKQEPRGRRGAPQAGRPPIHHVHTRTGPAACDRSLAKLLCERSTGSSSGPLICASVLLVPAGLRMRLKFQKE